MKEITIEEMKKVELDILKYIDDICRENNIEYFLMYGSLLGAVRHKGMIPWDDDIDIGLKREDYNKLINILKSKKNNQYLLLDKSIQKDYFYPFAKLVDTRTMVEEKVMRKIDNYGLFVDLFIMETLPNNSKLRNKIYNQKRKALRRIYYYGFKEITGNKLKNRLERLYKKCMEAIGITSILERYEKIFTKYDNSNGEYLICTWGVNDKIYQKKSFDKTIDCQFDGLTVKIPEKYDEILKTTYGDYMTLPPVEQRILKHELKMYWKNQ